MKIAIHYATRKGASAETGAVIKNILQTQFSFDVDILDLKKMKKDIGIDKYDNFIIGTSIAYDRWTKEAKKFLSRDFKLKKIAIFVCSGNAGGAFKKGDSEEYNMFSKRYIDDIIIEYPHIKPISTKAFGGWVKYFGITFFNNWNKEEVVSWAKKLGEQLSK